jgi:hypothetical protein
MYVNPSVVPDNSTDEARELAFVTDEHQFDVAIALKRSRSRVHDDLGTEVTAHGIK